jgi:hypothetical protein
VNTNNQISTFLYLFSQNTIIYLQHTDMKQKIFLCAMAIALAVSGFGQTKVAQLAGVWHLEQSIIKTDTGDKTDDLAGYDEYLTLDSVGVFAKYAASYNLMTTGDTALSFFGEGTWELKNDIIRYTFNSPFYSGGDESAYNDTVLVVTDSSLLILEIENLISSYKKINAVPANLLAMCLPKEQKESKPITAPLLLYRKNPDKPTLVQKYSYIQFNLYPKNAGDCMDCCTDKWAGNYINKNNDSVIISKQWHQKVYNDSNDNNFINTAYYNVYGDVWKEDPHSIAYAEIESVTYNNPFRTKVNDASNTVMTIGVIAALLVAPLANITKHGNFNGARYMRFAAYGLGFTAVGVTLNLTSQPRKYKIVK